MADNTSDPAGQEALPIDRASGPWLTAIKDAQSYFKYWQEKSDGIDKLYADLKSLAEAGGEREFQMFWANLEILKPSIYSRPPAPVVVPRFKDMKELPRKASEMLERTLMVNFEEKDINAVMLQIRDDMATNGRGAAWLRLEDYGDGVARNCFEHVDRADFLHEPARKWEEVGWVAKRAWLTREQGVKRFGDAFIKVNLKSRKEMLGDDQPNEYDGERKGEVWEIWSKSKGVVVWVSEGVEDVLDIQEPFLKLEGFYPCPKPAYSTTERRKLIPVPDFVYYKDQLEEINELTARISALSESLRMKGFYPAGAGDLAESIETAIKLNDNNAMLVPVSNFAALGGTALKDSIIWLPVVEIANTIKELVLLRRQLIDDVYQITGLSDIMRGATDPKETLGAQELKSQYGSIRIRDRQAELVRIARDITRISAEIMAENYTPEQFASMAQMDLPTDEMIQGQIQQLTQQAAQIAQSPQAQQAAQTPEGMQQLEQLKAQAEQQLQTLQNTVTLEKVVGLLREQRMRPFILEIETDSTIQVDEDAEKQRRTEFLTALGGVMQQFGPLVLQQPESAPFVVETLKFAVAPFRAGRSLEGAIEQFAEAIEGKAQQAAQNPTPSPDQIKAEQDDKRLALEAKKHEDEMKLKAAEMQLKSQDMDQTHERENRKARTEGGKPAAEGGEAQPSQYSVAEVLDQIGKSQAIIVQALQQMAQAIAAPKSVTTPEGRTYTTQSMTGQRGPGGESQLRLVHSGE